jgi:hypothetical protein
MPNRKQNGRRRERRRRLQQGVASHYSRTKGKRFQLVAVPDALHVVGGPIAVDTQHGVQFEELMS